MLGATRAILLVLHTLRVETLVLARVVVPLFALAASEGDVVSRHSTVLLRRFSS
jgi:hypothetical protein